MMSVSVKGEGRGGGGGGGGGNGGVMGGLWGSFSLRNYVHVYTW